MVENIPETKIVPFNKGYVIKVTAQHMLKSIDISIRKTFNRLPEFLSDPDKSIEVFETLQALHAMRKQLDDFQVQNSQNFKGERNVRH